jgi:hypothetical protein
MALDFPSSPALNQVFTSGNRSWIWNGTEWIGNTPIINYTANRVLLGNGTSLFQEVAPGTAGNLLTSNGTTWTSATAPAGGITNVVTATGNTTLTSTPTLLRITPTDFGTTVKLPDATTMTVGTGKFEIQNLSEFHVRIANNSGTLLGFVDRFGVVEIELSNNASSAGTWVLSAALRYGVSAESPINTTWEQIVAAGNPTQSAVIELDSDRAFVLVRSSTGILYGQAYDQATNTWGSPTLIRNAVVNAASAALKISSSAVLVASSTTSTAFEAVVVSISGTTITVNTATTLTLGAAVNQFQFFKAVPSGGFVYGYTNTTGPTSYLVPMTVSGTTVTLGSVASAFSGATGSTLYGNTALDKIVLYNPGDDAGSGGFIVYSLSGTTLTAGTRVSVGVSTNSGSRFVQLTNTTFFFDAFNSASATGYVGVLSISGTTATRYISANISTVAGSQARAMFPVTSTKIFFSFSDGSSQIYWNLLTFTGSAVTLGTALTSTPASVTTGTIGLSGTDLSVTGSNNLIVLDCSGASLTVKTLFGNGSILFGLNPNSYGVAQVLVSGGVLAGGPAQTNQRQFLQGLRSVTEVPNLSTQNGSFGNQSFSLDNQKTGFLIAGVVGGRSIMRKLELV